MGIGKKLPSDEAVAAAAAVVHDSWDMRESWKLQTTREMLEAAYAIDFPLWPNEKQVDNDK